MVRQVLQVVKKQHHNSTVPGPGGMADIDKSTGDLYVPNIGTNGNY